MILNLGTLTTVLILRCIEMEVVRASLKLPQKINLRCCQSDYIVGNLNYALQSVRLFTHVNQRFAMFFGARNTCITSCIFSLSICDEYLKV